MATKPNPESKIRFFILWSSPEVTMPMPPQTFALLESYTFVIFPRTRSREKKTLDTASAFMAECHGNNTRLEFCILHWEKILL